MTVLRVYMDSNMYNCNIIKIKICLKLRKERFKPEQFSLDTGIPFIHKIKRIFPRCLTALLVFFTLYYFIYIKSKLIKKIIFKILL